jgi:thiamine biosynthesis protein ThiS
MIAALPRVHAVTDDRVVARGDVPALAARMAERAGPALGVHVRARNLDGGAFLALARAVGDAVRPRGAWLVVNDRADVARMAGADAVVSGRGGLAVADVRRLVPGAPVARSVHDAAEIAAAVAEGADFLVAGSVFSTASHAGVAPAGPALVREAAATGRPVLAIGGVTPERVPELLDAGAWGVAAIRALWDAADPAAAAAAFLEALPADDRVSVTINGEPRRARRGITVAQLLADLALDPRTVVVEHNRRVVRRDALETATVTEGDRLELVHFVGGG